MQPLLSNRRSAPASQESPTLPIGLAAPVDNGACDHLTGMTLPPVVLASASGTLHPLAHPPSPWLVLYVYPQTGGPGIDLPPDWDLIPGARGCTPQSCAFRDHHGELQELGATVWGLSTQRPSEQREFAERMHIPFPLLNDSALTLANHPLRLPTFTVEGVPRYMRVTLVAHQARITKVYFPVYPPQQNAVDVLAYLRARQPRRARLDPT